MSVAIGIVLTIILIPLIVISRRNKATTVKRPSSVSRDDLANTGSQFHAVSIRSSGSACEAAKAMGDKRFLSSAAPRIPLANCDVPDCKCRFIHHQDRRRGEDRRGQHPQNTLGATGGYAGIERRYRGDRRDNNDPADFFA